MILKYIERKDDDDDDDDDVDLVQEEFDDDDDDVDLFQEKQDIGFLSTEALNKIYQNNKIKENDHRETPEIILDIVQEIVEKKCSKGSKWFDACPFHCSHDNLDYKLWPIYISGFANPPFSGSNPKIWMQ